jgi:phytoene synthase
MVNVVFTNPDRAGTAMNDIAVMIDPERELALGYARPAEQPAIRALFGLDCALAQVLRTTREPMVGQMRLIWWHEALTRLDVSPPPAEPVLQSLAREALPRGVTGARLAGMVDGWEELLEPELLGDDALIRHATGRGGRLFEMAGKVIGARDTDPVAVAGKGWALADLGRHLSDRALAERALGLAAAPIAEATRGRWSRAARPLGALARIARLNLAVPLDQPLPIGAPARVGRILLHRFTGR